MKDSWIEIHTEFISDTAWYTNHYTCAMTLLIHNGCITTYLLQPDTSFLLMNLIDLDCQF